VTPRRFALPGFRVEAAEGFAVADPAAAAGYLADPSCATRTLHWGRNYLYLAQIDGTDGAAIEVVVKQFRPDRSWRAQIGWHLAKGSRAAKSWRVAHALRAAGIPTPAPLLWLEPERVGGAALFVCRFLPGRIEARYLLRARNAGRDREEFPQVDSSALIVAIARLARRLHDAGFWHRDFSIGNLLVLPGPLPTEIAEITLVDLNRCRVGRTPSLSERMRDLSRLALERPGDRTALLDAYFAGPDDGAGSPAAKVPTRARWTYELARRSFHGRHRWKRRLRSAAVVVKSWIVPRGTHAHIPQPPEGAAPRDRIVWDALSDQPHSHAGRLGRARVRFADLGDHARSFGAFVAAVPRIRRRYREIRAEIDDPARAPFAWPGVGVALRPWPADPEAHLEAFFGLGVPQALVRLHPWESDRRAEVDLARDLASAGIELTFALPQSRELVRDPARWRAAIEAIAELFTPFGARFQIGQAINRSKWGVWNYGEYLDLAGAAAEILRRRPGVELAGPAVIDFEAHATAAVVDRRHASLRFDALASLLYVDRRGAPENSQLGFDTVDKVAVLAAIAGTSRLVTSERQWITEVNWPLREGPHSPAGRKVAVDEATQAEYLARYYLLTLGSGLVERVFWWQLTAKGYGLIDPGASGGLRRRQSYAALATLARVLPPGASILPPPAVPAGGRVVRAESPRGGEVWAVWAPAGHPRLRFSVPPESVLALDGGELPLPAGDELELGPAVRYLRFAASRRPRAALAAKIARVGPATDLR